MDATNRHIPSDDELIKAVALGDSAAFEHLYRRYESRVYQFVLALLHDQKLAEDTVVEVMVGVWQGAARFSGASRLSTWIFGIARHKAMDTLRDKTRLEQATVPLERVINLPHLGDGPEEMTEQRKIEALMRHAFAKLSLQHQQILRLAFHEELPYQEIARLLDIPVNTVKTRVFYAKRQLKRHFEHIVHAEPSK